MLVTPEASAVLAGIPAVVETSSVGWAGVVLSTGGAEVAAIAKIVVSTSGAEEAVVTPRVPATHASSVQHPDRQPWGSQ